MLVADRPSPTLPGVRLDVRGVTATAGDGSAILRNASLCAAPGQLVAVLGASGSGKSTLLEVIAGVRPPQHGHVLFGGAPATSSQRATTLGYVPQDDLVHRELPLRRTLLYAAALRLPAGTPRKQIDHAVDDALRALDLTHRAGVRVRDLSGGERKRASIAVELLTRPGVLLLDEPTSGLDPLARASVLRRLRGLADAGATVVLTTHVTRDAESCDAVVVLGEGGRVAFAGDVEAALARFDVHTLDEIYERVAADTETTAVAYAPSPAAYPPARGPEPPRPTGGVRQCLLLTRRNAAVIASSRLTLSIMIGSPLAVVLMFAVLFRPGAFDPSHPSPAAALMIAFWIAFGAFFFGLTYGLLQIVTELGIVRRERVGGLHIGAYLASKVLTLLPALVLVVAAMLGALRLLDRLPAAGFHVYGPLAATAVLCGLAALALGLLTSAAVADPAQATLALPMLCFPQVLFSGAILPLSATAAAGRAIGAAMSTRWAFEGIGHGLGIEGLLANGASPLGRPLLAQYGDSFAGPYWTGWAILAGFAVLSLAGAWWVLRRRLARPAR
jgi:ABC-type multidrug transport system ATPase subunit